MSRKSNTIKSTSTINQVGPKDQPDLRTIEYVKTCSDCRFWFQLRDAGPDPLVPGQCRHGPPTFPKDIVEGGTIHVYRLTLPLYPACGQFEAR